MHYLGYENISFSNYFKNQYLIFRKWVNLTEIPGLVEL